MIKTTITQVQISISELNSLIRKYEHLSNYDVEYEQDWYFEEPHYYTVDGNYSKETWLETFFEPQYKLDTILNKMCADGIIESGNYIIGG